MVARPAGDTIGIQESPPIVKLTVGFMDKSPCGAVAAVGPVNSAKVGGDFSTDKHE